MKRDKIVFYKVFVERQNKSYFYIDYAKYDDAISYYTHVKENPDIKFIDVSRVEENENGILEPVEILASFS